MKYPMIRKNGRLSSSLAAVTSAALSAGLLHTSPVFAQADGSAYEEVVVTARKRDEKLLENRKDKKILTKKIKELESQLKTKTNFNESEIKLFNKKLS